MSKGVGKRAQVTIFIIIAILIVVAVVIFFLFRSKVIETPSIFKGDKINPTVYLSECVQPDLEEGISIISKQGGYISNPSNITYWLNDEAVDVSYLCYNPGNYAPCVNQEPNILGRVNSELKEYLKSQKTVENCWDGLLTELDDKGYSITDIVSAKDNFEIEVLPGIIRLNTNSKFTLNKGDESSRKENIQIEKKSNIYYQIVVAQEITNQAYRFCEFNYLGYMSLYPKWKIIKKTSQDGSGIYSIKFKDEGEWFNLAVRGCIVPRTLI